MLLMSMRPIMDGDTIRSILSNKHLIYYRRSVFYKYAYYIMRATTGVGAASIPIIINYSIYYASIIPGAVVLVTVLDTVFVPREKWKPYSRISDQLWVQQIKESGDYEKHKARIETILGAEQAGVEMIDNLKSMLRTIEDETGTSSL